MAQVEDGLAVWHGGSSIFSGAINAGDGVGAADVERTALATYALLRMRTYPDLAVQGLAMLANSRDASGTWGSPQATILALKAFLAAAQGGYALPVASTVHVAVDEIPAEPVSLRTADPDRAYTLVFDELSKGYNDVEIAVEGQGATAYRVVGAYYLPWSQVTLSSPEEQDVSLEVSYDRTSVKVAGTITATVGVTLNRPGVARLVVLELGLPPGLAPVMEDWEVLVERGVIAHYERIGEQIVAYLTDLSAEQPVQFSYRLRARFPLSVKTQPTRAFDVANPQRPAIRQPIEIEVLAETGS